jgi:hypothetical protein
MDGTIWIWILAILLVVAGVVGTALPVLPGVPLVYAGLIFAAWADDFERVSWITIVLLGLLTVLSIVVDLIATLLSAKRVGASGLAIAGAAIGSVVGLFFGIPGLILGPFIGAISGELIARRHMVQASRVGFATWLGLILGTLAKLALAFAMLAIFATAYVL